MSGRHSAFTPLPDAPRSAPSRRAAALTSAPASGTGPYAVRPQTARGTRRGTVAVALAAAGLLVCLGLGAASVLPTLGRVGGVALALGTLTALAGAYLCLVLLLLVSRLPWLEREVGHDRMVALHRRVAPYALLLVLAHVLLTTVSYAQAAETSVLGQFWNLVTRSAWMMPALAAFLLMMGAGVMSYRGIRRRLAYETWWVVHLYFYLAVALSFGHQVALGPMFVTNPVQRWFWTALYLGVAATILATRVLLPLRFSLRHQLHVVEVVPESHGVVSLHLGGTDLDRIDARGGQFLLWRVMARGWWWQAHPYSLSASPTGDRLRITVRTVGDHSAMLRHVAPGTRVWAEGPYGVVTADARHRDQVTLIAAGSGITAIRGVLDELPPTTDVVVVHRVADAATATFRDELARLGTRHGWRVHYLEGPRAEHPITPELLRAVAPMIVASDVYVCGPPGFTMAVVDAASRLGVPAERIHHESYAL